MKKIFDVPFCIFLFLMAMILIVGCSTRSQDTIIKECQLAYMQNSSEVCGVEHCISINTIGYNGHIESENMYYKCLLMNKNVGE